MPFQDWVDVSIELVSPLPAAAVAVVTLLMDGAGGTVVCESMVHFARSMQTSPLEPLATVRFALAIWPVPTPLISNSFVVLI